MAQHLFTQRLRMCRTNAVVDVQTVRLCPDCNDFSAQFSEQTRSQLISCPMRAVQHNLQPFKAVRNCCLKVFQIEVLSVIVNGKRA
ncbi:hypothetical protein D3C75_1142620 [compost metagenome]